MPFFSRSALKDGVAMREVWSWAAFDFANSGYTTVVLTAVFNAYFVSVVAGDAPSATFLWTVVIAVSNAVSMLLMPVIGTVADATATKKRWLAVATFMAVGGTLGLMFAGPGTIVWASLMIIVSNVAYNVGESLNSAFLPELAREDAVGKVSGWGWSFGYCGGILTLGLCLGVVLGGEKLGYGMDQTVAGTMAVTAFVFAASALPIFLFLKERSVPRLDAADREAVRSAASESFAELRRTLGSLGDFRDFAWLSVCGFLYQCGVSVVITLSAVYAAAVILPDNYQEILALSGLNDSKKLSEKKREQLYDAILSEALAYGIGMQDNASIDEINILEATKEAMRCAILEAERALRAKTGCGIDHILIDALTLREVAIPQTGIIKGDSASLSIAAASILAKVTRDRMMVEYDSIYPGYAFAKNKGYGTKAHYEGLQAQGMTPIHRRSFLKNFK